LTRAVIRNKRKMVTFAKMSAGQLNRADGTWGDPRFAETKVQHHVSEARDRCTRNLVRNERNRMRRAKRRPVPSEVPA
jgi:hypothetical protein